MPEAEYQVSAPAPNRPSQRGCACSLRACFLFLLLLYGLQCLAALAAIWHKYEQCHTGQVRLTLYYPANTCIAMLFPGVGGLPCLIHWVSGGRDLELVKALDIQLPDGRKYTLYCEDYESLAKLGIRETSEGIQLTDDRGENYVDTPLIPFSAFRP